MLDSLMPFLNRMKSYDSYAISAHKETALDYMNAGGTADFLLQEITSVDTPNENIVSMFFLVSGMESDNATISAWDYLRHRFNQAPQLFDYYSYPDSLSNTVLYLVHSARKYLVIDERLAVFLGYGNRVANECKEYIISLEQEKFLHKEQAIFNNVSEISCKDVEDYYRMIQHSDNALLLFYIWISRFFLKRACIRSWKKRSKFTLLDTMYYDIVGCSRYERKKYGELYKKYNNNSLTPVYSNSEIYNFLQEAKEKLSQGCFQDAVDLLKQAETFKLLFSDDVYNYLLGDSLLYKKIEVMQQYSCWCMECMNGNIRGNLEIANQILYLYFDNNEYAAHSFSVDCQHNMCNIICIPHSYAEENLLKYVNYKDFDAPETPEGIRAYRALEILMILGSIKACKFAIDYYKDISLNNKIEYCRLMPYPENAPTINSILKTYSTDYKHNSWHDFWEVCFRSYYLKQEILQKQKKFYMLIGHLWEDVCQSICARLHETTITNESNNTLLPNGTIADIAWGNIVTNGVYLQHASVIIECKKSLYFLSSIDKSIDKYIPYCDELQFWILEATRSETMGMSSYRFHKPIKFICADDLTMGRLSDNERDQIYKLKDLSNLCRPISWMTAKSEELCEAIEFCGFPSKEITTYLNSRFPEFYSLFNGNGTAHLVVRQYTLEGVFMKEYEDILDASEKTGVPLQRIKRCLWGEKPSAGGFIWKREKRDTHIKKIKASPTMPVTFAGKKVLQIDPYSGELIKEFTSAKYASEETGINQKSIRDAIKGIQKTAGGYRWQFAE